MHSGQHDTYFRAIKYQAEVIAAADLPATAGTYGAKLPDAAATGICLDNGSFSRLRHGPELPSSARRLPFNARNDLQQRAGA